MTETFAGLTVGQLMDSLCVDELTDSPVVGVSVSLNFPGATAKQTHEMKLLISFTLKALVDLGIRPVVLDASAKSLPDYDPNRLDGLIVLGGGDIDPSFLGHFGSVPNTFGVDARADGHTIAMIRRVSSNNAPILGICRGSQLLNVAFGGSIFLDLGDSSNHRARFGDSSFTLERVRLKEGSIVGDVYGRDEVEVPAAHHQSVDRLASRFVPVAWADDGIVEAIEGRKGSWVVGLQWHPEARGDKDPEFRAILDRFKVAVDSMLSCDGRAKLQRGGFIEP